MKSILKPNSKLVELGCGQGLLLREIARQGLLPEENIFGLDQSQKAVDYVLRALPKASAATGDIYHLDTAKNFFDVCLLMETIEHWRIKPALDQIFSVMAGEGACWSHIPIFQGRTGGCSECSPRKRTGRTGWCSSPSIKFIASPR
ncbi:MAG: class I SAM-dependent methyltransferase [Verrucomicrobia bacterium]|nr:class I SAM-dependent methyltransferase [Verrucomicrobiota bacterium]